MTKYDKKNKKMKEKKEQKNFNEGYDVGVMDGIHTFVTKLFEILRKMIQERELDKQVANKIMKRLGKDIENFVVDEDFFEDLKNEGIVGRLDMDL